MISVAQSCGIGVGARRAVLNLTRRSKDSQAANFGGLSGSKNLIQAVRIQHPVGPVFEIVRCGGVQSLDHFL